MFTGSFPINTFCFLSTVTTIFCSTSSRTVLVFGTSTSIPDCKIGAVIMKIISSTSTTSMNGIMLISDSVVCVPFPSVGISEIHYVLGERLFDLRRNFKRKRIEPLRELTNISQKLIVENYGGNRGEESGRCGHKRFRNARRYRAKRCGPCVTQSGKCINDSPNCAKQTDEGCHRPSRCQPGHS